MQVQVHIVGTMTGELSEEYFSGVSSFTNIIFKGNIKYLYPLFL